jgi:hypothetical protein
MPEMNPGGGGGGACLFRACGVGDAVGAEVDALLLFTFPLIKNGGGVGTGVG